jgi:hypothetical protein
VNQIFDLLNEDDAAVPKEDDFTTVKRMMLWIKIWWSTAVTTAWSLKAW